MKKIKKPKKIRNWEAIKAHGKNSQGPMKNRKKEQNKNKCRKSKRKKEKE